MWQTLSYNYRLFKVDMIGNKDDLAMLKAFETTKYHQYQRVKLNVRFYQCVSYTYPNSCSFLL